MIIHHSKDYLNVVFSPENIQERKKLDLFPGLIKEGLAYYCPNKHNVFYNLYSRIRKKFKDIKFTPAIKEMIDGDIVIKQIPEDFKFHTTPLKHQLIALRFAYTYGSFLNLSEPGLGKTKVTLDFIYLMKFKKSLIVCPKPLRFVWQEEVAKHRPELSIYVVETTNWAKECEKVMAADIVVVNYDKTVSFESELQKIPFDFIAVDEALIKDPTTDRTKCITRMGENIPYKCAMSGTLVNNSPLDMFAPTRFIEPALTGKAFGKFRDEYVISSKFNRFITVGFKNVTEVKDMLASCSVIMTKEEWLKDLPKKEFQRRYVQMGDLQYDYYHKLANNYLLNIDSLGVEVEVDNPLTVLCKLNQISNGFIYYNETGTESTDELFGEETKKKQKVRSTFFFDQQPKALEMLSLIDSKEFNSYESNTSSFSGTRAIIWFNLAAELQIIEEALKSKGHTYLTIKGGDKDIGGKIKTFNTDPSVRFCVCQAKTINYGVTILGTSEENLEEEVYAEFDPIISDEIFYSVNFSLEVFLQQQDRIHRIGQVRTCRYWLILSNSKIERTIADRLEEKLRCNREILVDIVSRLEPEEL